MAGFGHRSSVLRQIIMFAQQRNPQQCAWRPREGHYVVSFETFLFPSRAAFGTLKYKNLYRNVFPPPVFCAKVESNLFLCRSHADPKRNQCWNSKTITASEWRRRVKVGGRRSGGDKVRRRTDAHGKMGAMHQPAAENVAPKNRNHESSDRDLRLYRRTARKASEKGTTRDRQGKTGRERERERESVRKKGRNEKESFLTHGRLLLEWLPLLERLPVVCARWRHLARGICKAHSAGKRTVPGRVAV